MKINAILHVFLSMIPVYIAYTYKGFAENCILDRSKFGVDKLIVLAALIAYILFVMFMTNFRISFNGSKNILKIVMFSFILSVLSMYFSKMFYNCDVKIRDPVFYGIATIAGILPILLVILEGNRNRI